MIKDVLTKETIVLDLEAKDKLDLFTQIAKKAKNLGVVSDVQQTVEDFYEKEQNSETYLGTHCVIPHTRSPRVLKNTIFFVRTNKFIKWSDEHKTRYIFAILAENGAVDKHIDMLMDVSKKVLNHDELEILKRSENLNEIYEILVK